MVFDATDADGMDVVVFGDAGEVAPDRLLDVGVNQWHAGFGAPDAVVEEAGVGVGHGGGV